MPHAEEPPPYRLPPPAGPFIEVPYHLHQIWLGQSYAEVVEHHGFPPAVLRQLREPERWIGRVAGWSGYAAYCAANGTDACPDGLAWLEVGQDAKLRMHSGTWNAPRRTGARGRWRW